MREFDLTASIGIISTFIALLLAAFIFSVESRNKISNKLFGTFLILNAFEFSSWFMHLFFDVPNNFLIAKSLLAYLPLPIFYLYILSVCYSDFRLKWKHLWHGAPFVIGNFVMLPRVYLSTTSQKLQLFENYNYLPEILFLQISLHLQSIFYIVAGFIVLNRSRKIFLENYSSSSIETYKWLFQLLVFTAILYSVAIVKNILKYSGKEDIFHASQMAVILIVLCVVCWYVLKALRYPALFSGVDSGTELTEKLIDEDRKEPAIANAEEIEKLNSYMDTEKPYLDPSLSLKTLADGIEMNSRDLSVLINQRLHQHFFDYINAYRIKEAKEILGDPEKKDYTILEVLYEVGFNSKSSFNTAFKKYTGKTPTEFRQSS